MRVYLEYQGLSHLVRGYSLRILAAECVGVRLFRNSPFSRLDGATLSLFLW